MSKRPQHVVLSLEKDIKKQAETALTKAHHTKAELTVGLQKTYDPAIEGGEQFPPEVQRLQVRTEDVLAEVSTELTGLFDITFDKEEGNRHCKADVIVDGKVMLAAVPITYLLWLEKKLVDMNTFVSKLPILSEAEEWSWDASQSCYVAKPVKTAKTAKVPTTLEKAKATAQHPAQVDVINIDKTIGHWTTIKRSGALPSDRVRAIQARVRTLQAAVKVAREQANATEVDRHHIGATVFSYLFGTAESK